MDSNFEIEKEKLIEDNGNNLYNEGKISIIVDDINSIKRKIVLQNNIIKSYDGWIHLLINIINENNKKNHNSHRTNGSYNDFATSIEKGLEKIEHLSQSNIDLKLKYLQELQKKDINLNTINKINNQYNIIKDDMAINNKQLLILEKQQLLNTINSISEENISLNKTKNKKNFLRKILNLNNFMKKYNIFNKIQHYKHENNQLKQILDLNLKHDL